MSTPDRSPRVTIGVPVHNGEKYLRQALDSVVGQTYEDFEVVISDNASTDSTPAICAKYVAKDARFRYERQPLNLGAAANYNRVVELARGRYFKWLAHDDWCEPMFLASCVEKLDRCSSVVLAYTDTFVVDPHDNYMYSDPDRLLPQQRTPLGRMVHTLNNLNMANAVFGLIRTTDLRKTGLIGAYVASDYVLMLELSLLGAFVRINEPLVGRRWHPGGSRQEANPTAADVQAWFDGGVRRRVLVPPSLRLPFEYMLATVRSPIGVAMRVVCAIVVVPVYLSKRGRVALGAVKARLLSRFSSQGTTG